MDAILIALIAFKVVCLFFCGKGIWMARKEKKNKADKGQPADTSREWKKAQHRMNQLIEENQKLSQSVQEMKKAASPSPKQNRNSVGR
ncbi:hypothetical protein [Alteribacillus bidgolensis]|uniref:Uncharacterized protein n=1 Tax=Alteribacillus bidgolensis TaxID=930129 RepID=A0A1G8R6J1_9BACI|nr:hypothetical protein [Alteribacillus bidgolensis]SDJ12604.1 hypothetical protein SAMN05216352_12513 [Alteribacillus bidgolensis]